MAFIEDDVENTLDIFAVMKVDKTWAMFDGTYNPRTWKTWTWFTFDFDAGTVYIDTYPSGPLPDPADPSDPDTYDWDRIGTIIDYDYAFPT